MDYGHASGDNGVLKTHGWDVPRMPMTIPFSCPTCGKVLKAPSKAAGKKAQCPKCAQLLRIPSIHKAILGIPVPEPVSVVSSIPRQREAEETSLESCSLPVWPLAGACSSLA